MLQPQESQQNGNDEEELLTWSSKENKEFKKFCIKTVSEWILDHGNYNKGNRRNVLAEHHNEIGIIIGPHSTAEFCLIVMYAAELIDKKEG